MRERFAPDVVVPKVDQWNTPIHWGSAVWAIVKAIKVEH